MPATTTGGGGLAGNGQVDPTKVNNQIQNYTNSVTPNTTTNPDIYSVEQAVLGATTAYQNAVAQLNAQRQALLTQYGYKGTIDPQNGQMTNVSVDQYNPYGQLQQLLGSEAQDDLSARQGAMSRGLRGGLANQAVTSLRAAHGGQSAALGQNLDLGLTGLQGQQDSAFTDMTQTLPMSELQTLESAIASGSFDPATLGDGGQALLKKLLAQYGLNTTFTG